jgi:hypothetical protein
VALRLTNPSDQVVALPYPFHGTVLPGKRSIILPGQASDLYASGLRYLGVEDVPGYSGPYGSFSLCETYTPITWRLDTVNGNDKADGISSPLKTLAEVEARIPKTVRHDQLVDIESLTAVMPTWQRRDYAGGQIYVRGTQSTTILASTAAGVGSTNAIVKSSGLSVGQYRDYWIHILSGAASSDWRMIKDVPNTTDIVPVRSFSAAIQSGDRYEIVDNAVSVSLVDKPVIHGSPSTQGSYFDPCINFENLKFVTAGALLVGRVAFWRCCLNLASFLTVFSNQRLALCGVDGNTLGVPSAFAPQRVYGGAITAYVGAGISLRGIEEPSGGGIYGYVNSTLGMTIRNAVYTQIFGGNIRDDHTTIYGPNTTVVFGGDVEAIPLVATGQATGALRVRGGGYCQLVRAFVNGAGTIGTAVETGGVLELMSSPNASVTLVGASYGIHARRGGGRVILHQEDPNPPSVSGGIAAYACGEGPTTAASFASVGGTLAPASGDDGSRITRVD